MTIDEAIAHVQAGGRVTCDELPRGAVLKTETRGWSRTPPRVVWERTGDGYEFRAKPEYEAATWRKVKGWANYGTI